MKSDLTNRLFGVTGQRNLPALCQRLVALLLPEIQRFKGPVGVEWLAERKGIPVQTKDVTFHGRLQRAANGSATITLKKYESHEDLQHQFTLAHELGHWVIQEALGDCRTTLYRGMPVVDEKREEEEKLADAVACEILLPLNRVLRCFPVGLTHKAVANVQTRCRVDRRVVLQQYSAASNRRVLWLTCVPQIYKDLNSTLTVDEGWYWTGDGTVRCSRDEIAFCEQISFVEGQKRGDSGVSVRIADTRDLWKFDSQFAVGSVPSISMVSEKMAGKARGA